MKKMKEEESITYIPIRYDLPTKIRMITEQHKREKERKWRKYINPYHWTETSWQSLHFRRLISVGNRLKERIQKKLKWRRIGNEVYFEISKASRNDRDLTERIGRTSCRKRDGWRVAVETSLNWGRCVPLISTNCRHRRTDINIRLIDIIPVTPRDRSASKPIDRNFGGARETNGGQGLLE